MLCREKLSGVSVFESLETVLTLFEEFKTC